MFGFVFGFGSRKSAWGKTYPAFRVFGFLFCPSPPPKT